MDIKITEDGIVSFEETKVLKQVALKDFIENLKDIKPISTGFLPSGCIHFSKQAGELIYVFEETPQMRILNWNGRNISGVVPYPISLPFIYWIIRMNDKFVTKIQCRSSLVPVRDLSQEVCNASLPNFYDGGEGDMCRGSTNIAYSNAKKIINNLWESNWNGDLNTYMPENASSYSAWASETIKDPLFWMKLKLIKCRTKDTLGDVIESR